MQTLRDVGFLCLLAALVVFLWMLEHSIVLLTAKAIGYIIGVFLVAAAGVGLVYFLLGLVYFLLRLFGRR